MRSETQYGVLDSWGKTKRKKKRGGEINRGKLMHAERERWTD